MNGDTKSRFNQKVLTKEETKAKVATATYRGVLTGLFEKATQSDTIGELMIEMFNSMSALMAPLTVEERDKLLSGFAVECDVKAKKCEELVKARETKSPVLVIGER